MRRKGKERGVCVWWLERGCVCVCVLVDGGGERERERGQ